MTFQPLPPAYAGFLTFYCASTPPSRTGLYAATRSAGLTRWLDLTQLDAASVFEMRAAAGGFDGFVVVAG